MPPSHLALLSRLHHPLVRDLAWVILAPDLIVTPYPGRPSASELGLGDDATLQAWLSHLEQSPQELQRYLGETLAGRMGLYHERLWQFLLEHAPAIRLLAHNQRILRGKLTLGELDLLYRRKDDPTPVHLEVAIKFYLGVPDGPGAATDQARWIGPSGADSLAIKRERLHRHQLPLSGMAEAREAIRSAVGETAYAANGPMLVERRLAMPGVLFYPWHAHLPAPREAGPEHLSGQWLFWRDWQRWRASQPAGTRGAWLSRPHWFAEPRDEQLWSMQALGSGLTRHFQLFASPLQLVVLTPDGQRQRLFLVADDWPRQIPLPPMSTDA
ncbi:DUF1853 family protein [Halomonas korlensis]|uniref:DUF1853 domain-containing protein n=1 Tax=Halomonas korlensis TaxID=463301 RepID=A0A1I7JSZ0_9GAMM|nr:DUF1853 family protein [Halomonas korlensis]SFU88321.1 hypothetical protein SAMN04487955_11227 [Halomonas korlensis]